MSPGVQFSARGVYRIMEREGSGAVCGRGLGFAVATRSYTFRLLPDWLGCLKGGLVVASRYRD